MALQRDASPSRAPSLISSKTESCPRSSYSWPRCVDGCCACPPLALPAWRYLFTKTCIALSRGHSPGTPPPAALICDFHQVRLVLSRPYKSADIEWELQARPTFSFIPCPSRRSGNSRCAAYTHTLRFLSRSHTSRPSTPFTSIRMPSARYVPIIQPFPAIFWHAGLIDHTK